MGKQKAKQYNAQFKFTVVLEAFAGEKAEDRGRSAARAARKAQNESTSISSRPRHHQFGRARGWDHKLGPLAHGFGRARCCT